MTVMRVLDRDGRHHTRRHHMSALRAWWRRFRQCRSLPPLDDDYGGPYGASAHRLDPDLWDYGRKSGWW